MKCFRFGGCIQILAALPERFFCVAWNGNCFISGMRMEGGKKGGREGGGRMEGMGVAFRLDYLIESE